MEMQRAYSVLHIKAVNEDLREITGIATTPTPDRVGDIVEPMGAEFQLPIPLLWQHDSWSPVGHVVKAKVTEEGIEVVARFVKFEELGALKSRLDEAWQCVKSGLVRGLSIGFKEKESARIADTYSYRYLKWLWLELSAVTIPMNGEATITAIKSADELVRRAALGAQADWKVVRVGKGASRSTSPGASGRSTSTVSTQGTAMNIAEQLAAFEAKRKAAIERMDAIMEAAGAETRSLEKHEDEEYNTLDVEVKGCASHITRLKAHEAAMVARATPITVVTQQSQGGGVTLPGNGAIQLSRRNLPVGTAFVRYVALLARSKGNLMQAAELARRFDDSTPEVGIVLRAAVAAGTTSDATWAAPLVQYNDMVSEFIEFLRPKTIMGRLTKLRRVPFNVRIPRQTAGTSGQFVGEGKPKPVGKLAFDNITLTWAKASCICVLSDELVRMSNPAAEALVKDDLAAGITQYLDKRFLDPAYSGLANVSPASVSYNVAARQSSGTSLAALDDDVSYVMKQFTTNNLTLETGVWVMSPGQAINFSLMRDSQDRKAFPEINMNGGTFYGLPVITSNNVVNSGSPGDTHIYLIDQNEILLADDGQMLVDMSNEASLQMDDAPADGAQALVSLWQNGLVGVKVDRWINWAKRRAQAVQYIDNAAYN